MIKEYDLGLAWNPGTTKEVFEQIENEIYFRLNPHWIISSFENSMSSFVVEITDHETENSFVLNGSISFDESGYAQITGDGVDWNSIRFFQRGNVLHAEVDFKSDPPEETERRVVLWLRSVKEYLRLYVKRNINTYFFRVLMNRVILQMTPSQRKISLMLVRITLLELIVILIILVGWFFFIR